MHCGGGRAYKGLLTLLKDEGVETSRPFQNEYALACPECGHEINGMFNWCPRCGSRMVPYQCEYCQGIIPRDARTCPGCGAPAG